jgi:hypothetical protein
MNQLLLQGLQWAMKFASFAQLGLSVTSPSLGKSNCRWSFGSWLAKEAAKGTLR